MAKERCCSRAGEAQGTESRGPPGVTRGRKGAGEGGDKSRDRAPRGVAARGRRGLAGRWSRLRRRCLSWAWAGLGLDRRGLGWSEGAGLTSQVAKELELLAVGSLRAATEPRGRGRGRGAVPGEGGWPGSGRSRTSLPSLPWVPAPVTWAPAAAAAGRSAGWSVSWSVGQ